MFAVLALLASLIYGAADFLGGMAGRRMPVFTVVLWSQAVGLVLAVVAALGFPASQQRQLTGLGWGAIAGLLGTAGLVALYRGLAMGRMSIVSPIAALLSGLLPLGIGLGIGERPSPVQWIGIALAFPAIWLVASASAADVGRRRGGIGYGIVAGFGFGFFFAAIAQAGDGAGFWPLVGARMASVASVGIIA
ncbi:MAG: EamA family transporter, partial [Acidimicrobiia bacterium]